MELKRGQINTIRAKSLFKSSEQAIKSASNMPLNEDNLKSIIRELYEGLRQFCEAIGFIKGYKFSSHEQVTIFIKDVLKENSLSMKFDNYRLLRNGINYYGDDVHLETVKEALIEIPLMIKTLDKHVATS